HSAPTHPRTCRCDAAATGRKCEPHWHYLRSCVRHRRFLVIAHEFVRNHNKLDKKQLTFLNTEQLRGVELVDSVARLCCMNLVLHGIGSDATHVPVMVKDALAGKHGEYEMVLTNPPFGKKSSATIVNVAGDKQKQ